MTDRIKFKYWGEYVPPGGGEVDLDVFIEAFHKQVPITTRMRAAARVLHEVNDLEYARHPHLHAMGPSDLLDLSNKWDKAHEAKARKSKLVESLSADLKDLSHATVNAVELVADHLISKGWRKE